MGMAGEIDIPKSEPIKLPWAHSTYLLIGVGLLIAQGVITFLIFAEFLTNQLLPLSIVMFILRFIAPTAIALYPIRRAQQGISTPWVEWTWARGRNKGTPAQQIHIYYISILLICHLYFGISDLLFLFSIDTILRSWVPFSVIGVGTLMYLFLSYQKLEKHTPPQQHPQPP